MWGSRAHATLIGVLALLLFAASCGDDDDGELSREGVDETSAPAATVELPQRRSPYDINGIDLPDDVSEVVAVMSRLPETIEGYERADPVHGQGDVFILYGEGSNAVAEPAIAYRALNLASPDGTYPPDWTAGQVVESASVSEDDVLDFGIDGRIAWALRAISTPGTTTASEQQEIVFGETAGGWVFSVRASSGEFLGHAMDEFIKAASEG